MNYTLISFKSYLLGTKMPCFAQSCFFTEKRQIMKLSINMNSVVYTIRTVHSVNTGQLKRLYSITFRNT